MALPWPPRQFIKLLPIAFMPSRHTLLAGRPIQLQQTCSFPNGPHPKLRPGFCIGCLFSSDGGIRLPDTYRQNLVALRAVRRLENVARPAKHTRLPYIHEAFRLLLYQTRYGVICFAPFQQSGPDITSLRLPWTARITQRRRDARCGPCSWTPEMTIRRRELGGRPVRQRRCKFRQPPR